MSRRLGGLLTVAIAASSLLLPVALAAPVDHAQFTLQDPPPPAIQRRGLHGRFLHITDFHPDRFYHVYSSTDDEHACHSGQGPAGIYGAETSDCDSPVALINRTMEWISVHLKDKIDFVVWTGDSARHDNDGEHPRTVTQVAELNEFMVLKFAEVFGKHNGDEDDQDPNNDYVVPIVPNIGNNDVLPHNIMTPGPNSWTYRYASLWRQFIPEPQRHQFEQGGWYYVEVIPNRLAVFSLNTMYFFTSNSVVDGCAKRSEPGFRQFEWLRIQLHFMRDRGVKAIIIGHVPPARTEAKQQWDETCWQKYALWLKQYRDVIIASLWGHMNYDHFFLQSFDDISKDASKGRLPLSLPALPDLGDVQSTLSTDYFVSLREQWSRLPKRPKGMQLAGEWSKAGVADSRDEDLLDSVGDIVALTGPGNTGKENGPRERYLREIGGEYAEKFAVSFVSASVVPNLLPTLRVYRYNITGLFADEDLGARYLASPTARTNTGQDYLSTAAAVGEEEGGEGKEEEEEEIVAEDVDARRKKKHKKKKGKEKKYKFKTPEGPAKSSPPGPAYSPQTLSLLGLTQYYANLTYINNDFVVAGDEVGPSAPGGNNNAMKWKSGKHKGKKPHDKSHEPTPKKFEFKVLWDTNDEKVYNLQDLTVRSMVDLAQRIGAFKSQDVKPNTEAGEDFTAENRDRLLSASKGKDKRKLSKRNEVWYTFIRRAFVYTIEPEDFDERFNYSEDVE